MTFDEAVEKLKALSDKGADTWYGDSLDKRTNVKGHIEAGDIETIIYNLRQEYAPTIEMKPYQFEVFKKYRYGVSKGDIDFGGIWPDSPYRMMQYFKEEPYTGTTIWDDSFAKAWLHPETIKVVDD